MHFFLPSRYVNSRYKNKAQTLGKKTSMTVAAFGCVRFQKLFCATYDELNFWFIKQSGGLSVLPPRALARYNRYCSADLYLNTCAIIAPLTMVIIVIIIFSLDTVRVFLFFYYYSKITYINTRKITFKFVVFAHTRACGATFLRHDKRKRARRQYRDLSRWPITGEIGGHCSDTSARMKMYANND